MALLLDLLRHWLTAHLVWVSRLAIRRWCDVTLAVITVLGSLNGAPVMRLSTMVLWVVSVRLSCVTWMMVLVRLVCTLLMALNLSTSRVNLLLILGRALARIPMIAIRILVVAFPVVFLMSLDANAVALFVDRLAMVLLRFLSTLLDLTPQASLDVALLGTLLLLVSVMRLTAMMLLDLVVLLPLRWAVNCRCTSLTCLLIRLLVGESIGILFPSLSNVGILNLGCMLSLVANLMCRLLLSDAMLTLGRLSGISLRLVIVREQVLGSVLPTVLRRIAFWLNCWLTIAGGIPFPWKFGTPIRDVTL